MDTNPFYIHGLFHFWYARRRWILDDIRNLLQHVSGRAKLFASNVLIAFITGALGCSQAIAVIMTHSIMRTTYARNAFMTKMLC